MWRKEKKTNNPCRTLRKQWIRERTKALQNQRWKQRRVKE